MNMNSRPNLGSCNNLSSIHGPASIKAPTPNKFFKSKAVKTYSRKRAGNPPPPQVQPKKKRYNGTKYNIFEDLRYVPFRFRRFSEFLTYTFDYLISSDENELATKKNGAVSPKPGPSFRNENLQSIYSDFR